MNPRTTAVLVTLPLLLLGIADAKSKKLQVSTAFQAAHTVWVESVDGDIRKPGVSEADRRTVLLLDAGINGWGRYSLAPSRDRADIVIVIRKGHAVGDQDHLGLGMQPKEIEPPPPPGRPQAMPHSQLNTLDATPSMGGDDIAMQDLFRVYVPNRKGKLKKVWSSEMDGGLNPPTLQLFQQWKAAIEITYPTQTTALK